MKYTSKNLYNNNIDPVFTQLLLAISYNDKNAQFRIAIKMNRRQKYLNSVLKYV